MQKNSGRQIHRLPVDNATEVIDLDSYRESLLLFDMIKKLDHDADFTSVYQDVLKANNGNGNQKAE